MSTENNKIIAEFMWWKEQEEDFMFNPKTSGSIYIKSLLFHKDWNWLMEVVEKIESLGNYINITGTYTSIGAIEQKNRLFFIEKDSLNNKIEAVYKAVVEFIKWYNKNAVKS